VRFEETRRGKKRKKKNSSKLLTSHSRLMIVPIHATLRKSKAASAEDSGGTGCIK